MTFFQKAVYICIGLIVFNLCLVFVSSLNSFGNQDATGLEGINSSNALGKLTTLEDASMQGLFLLAIGLTGAGAIILSWITHSITPLGIHIFSVVFWSSYNLTYTVLSTNNYIPFEFLLIITVGMIFLFIAAVVGMLTGSG